MIKQNFIYSLTEQEAMSMISELKFLDKELLEKTEYIVKNAGVSIQEALEFVVNSDPVLWAKVYLNWTARGYQKVILRQGKRNKKIVLRLGRRLGKTECMCVLILWYAHTQINKGENNQYDILIITPYETQVDLIFDRLKQLIYNSPLLKDMITREVYHRIELSNGTKIAGLTAGSKSGTGAANTRGQRADLIILDEIDYMTSSDITNIYNIRNEAPDRIKFLVASTPSGKHEEFYKWCTGASIKFHPKKEDIDNLTFSDFEKKEIKNGNGWVEIYAPSTVNKELLKINPDTLKTYLEDIRDELSEMRYVQEVMAEFGEESLGVYQKKYIEKAIKEGERVNHTYTTKYTEKELKEFLSKRRTGPRILGVDWDKFSASTNMVCVELDKEHMGSNGEKAPMFKVLFRVEIPRSEFTYANAINKIIELNEIYNFDWIAVDRGYGEVQLELLKKYGIDNPETGFVDKVIGYQFSEKIEVRDPHTMKKDKKPIKPFMVNNSVIVFEKEKIIFDPEDKDMAYQFGNYKIKSISSSGLPIFNDDDEHLVDATNLALLTFEQKYGELMKVITSSRIKVIDGFKGSEEFAVKKRNDESQRKDKSHLAVLQNRTKTKVVSVVSNNRKSMNSVISRRSF